MSATFRWTCPILVSGLTRRSCLCACMRSILPFLSPAILTRKLPRPPTSAALRVHQHDAREGDDAPNDGERRGHLAEPGPGDDERQPGHEVQEARRVGG